MLHFEVITASFDKKMDTIVRKAELTSKNALEHANGFIKEKAQQHAPRHIQGYSFEGGFFPGGTLEGSFAAFESIGNYYMSSIYRMSGEKNPVAKGLDYAFFQEKLYTGPHNKGTTPYLQPAVQEGLIETLEFISNELYLD